MTQNLVMVLESNDEFNTAKSKLNGPLETITRKSKIYSFNIVDSAEAYGKTLELVKNTAREFGCDAVHVREVHYSPGLFAVTTTIMADLYKKKQQ